MKYAFSIPGTGLKISLDLSPSLLPCIPSSTIPLTNHFQIKMSMNSDLCSKGLQSGNPYSSNPVPYTLYINSVTSGHLRGMVGAETAWLSLSPHGVENAQLHWSGVWAHLLQWLMLSLVPTRLLQQCVHRSDTGCLAQQHPAAARKLKPQDTNTNAFFFFCTDIGGKPYTRELFLMDMVT